MVSFSPRRAYVADVLIVAAVDQISCPEIFEPPPTIHKEASPTSTLADVFGLPSVPAVKHSHGANTVVLGLVPKTEFLKCQEKITTTKSWPSIPTQKSNPISGVNPSRSSIILLHLHNRLPLLKPNQDQLRGRIQRSLMIGSRILTPIKWHQSLLWNKELTNSSQFRTFS